MHLAQRFLVRRLRTMSLQWLCRWPWPAPASNKRRRSRVSDKWSSTRPWKFGIVESIHFPTGPIPKNNKHTVHHEGSLIRQPRLQQEERVKGEITSSKDSKGQEARSKAKALFELWQPCVSSNLAAGKRKNSYSFLSVPKAMLGTTGRCPEARPVLHCHAVWVWHLHLLFYPFAHLHLLSSDPFSSLIFLLLLCSSLTLPTSAFPYVPLVGSLTSKLPLIRYILDGLLPW